MNQPRPTPPPRKRIQRPGVDPAPAAAPVPPGASGNRAIVIGFVAGVVTCVVVGMMVGLVYLFVSARNDRAPDVALAENESTQVDPAAAASVETERPTEEPPVDETPNDESAASSLREGADAEPDAIEADGPAPEPEEQHAPLNDVIEVRHERLILPPLNPEEREAGSEHLATIYVDDPSDVELELVGWEEVLEEGIRYSCEPQETRGGGRRWPIDISSDLVPGRSVGEFTLQDQDLRFDWARNESDGRLRYCLLKISVVGAGDEENKEALCALVNPRAVEPLGLRFSQYSYTIPLQVEDKLPSLENLQLEITVRGLPDEQWTLSSNILNARYQEVLGQDSTLEINAPFDGGEALVQLNLTLVVDNEGRPRLSVENRARPRMIQRQEEEVRITLPSGRELRLPGAVRIARPEPPIRCASAALEDARSQTQDVVSSFPLVLNDVLPARSRVIEGEFNALRRELNAEKGKKREEQNQALISRLQSALDLLQRLKDDIASLEGQYKEALEFARTQEEWLNQFEEFYADLESSVSLDFKFFVDIEGRTVPILQSVEPEALNEHEEGTTSSGYRDPF